MSSSSPIASDAAAPAPSRRVRVSTARGFPALIETTKPGITRLVTMTSMVGFGMAGLARSWTLGDLLVTGIACCVGTALSAAGANSLNQWMEGTRDARMDRTRVRPIPTGRSSSSGVLGFGTLLCAGGLAVLWMFCGMVAMLLSLACIVSYLAMYTPLKPHSPLATFVGAIPGALPPMIGAAAASLLPGWRAIAEPAGLALFALMMVWQIPHFLAIAWLYKDDYAKGGHAVLPVIDASGGVTVWAVALWSAALIPTTLLPVVMMPEVLGLPYGLIASASGVGFFVLALRLLAQRTRERARVVFFASIMHLPLLLAAMVVEGLVRTLA